jgi:hypothetical protein
MDWGCPAGKNCDRFVSFKPRDCRVSATDVASMDPVEFASRTENDSRRLWRSAGGSLLRLSLVLRSEEDRCRRGSRDCVTGVGPS